MEQTPSTPKIEDTWWHIWVHLFTRPTVETMRQILRETTVSPQRGYGWVFISGTVALPSVTLLLRDEPEFYSFVVVSFILGGLAVLLSFIPNSWFVQYLARRFGATGSHRNVHYLMACFTAPLTLINGVFVLLTVWNASLGTVLGFALTFAQLYFTALVLRAVNDTPWLMNLAIVAIASGILLVFGGFSAPFLPV